MSLESIRESLRKAIEMMDSISAYYNERKLTEHFPEKSVKKVTEIPCLGVEYLDENVLIGEDMQSSLVGSTSHDSNLETSEFSQASQEISREEHCIILNADIGVDVDEGECVTLSVDDGPCVDDVEKHVGVIDSTDMGGPGKLTIRSTLGKPPVYHPNTLKAATFAGVTTTSNLFRGELSPWVLTTTHNDNTPLNLEPIHAVKMKPFGNLGLVEAYGVGINPLKPSLAQEVDETLRVCDNGKVLTNNLQKDEVYGRNHPMGGLSAERNDVHSTVPPDPASKSDGAGLKVCVLGGGLMLGQTKEIKPPYFTPHFHHPTLIKLMICLVYLGAIAYIQGFITWCAIEVLGNNLGAKLRDGSTPLIPFTIFIYDPGGGV